MYSFGDLKTPRACSTSTTSWWTRATSRGTCHPRQTLQYLKQSQAHHLPTWTMLSIGITTLNPMGSRRQACQE
uniref:Uncharacterized protein n=1 Tax=Vombatus ursinus TaxID=29139 RepID=A0A4X2LNZ6_VOMUR